jgi:hypothetical protein
MFSAGLSATTGATGNAVRINGHPGLSGLCGGSKNCLRVFIDVFIGVFIGVFIDVFIGVFRDDRRDRKRGSDKRPPRIGSAFEKGGPKCLQNVYRMGVVTRDNSRPARSALRFSQSGSACAGVVRWEP